MKSHRNLIPYIFFSFGMISSSILILVPAFRSGIYGLFFGSIMVLSWLFFIIYASWLWYGKPAEKELNQAGWQKLPLWQRAFLAVILAIVLGMPVLFIDQPGVAMFLLPFIFTAAVYFIKLYIQKYQKVKKHSHF